MVAAGPADRAIAGAHQIGTPAEPAWIVSPGERWLGA
jgi:hypothetical protein